MENVKFKGFGLKSIGLTIYTVILISCCAHAQQWETVGNTPNGISNSWGSFQNLQKDASGNLYVSFYDGDVSKGSVMKYGGSTWSYLGGTAGITTGTATYSGLSVAANGAVFYCNQDGWPNSGMEVRNFSSNAWTALVKPEMSTVNFQSMVVGSNNLPIVAYSSGGTLSVKKYNGSAWDTLGTGLPSGTPYYLQMKISSLDTVYVGFVNSGMKVYKIHASATASDPWQEVGVTSFGATSSEQFRSSIALDNAGNVYAAFTSGNSGGNKLNVKKFQNGVWSDVGQPNFTSYRVHYVSIAVDNAGTPYVAYSNFENSPNNKNYVQKFNGSQWVAVGDSISTGAAKWNALNFDDNNNPILAYSDDGISAGGNMVKRFIGSTSCNNTMPTATIGSTGCVTFNYQGQPTTLTTVRGADGAVWLQQNLGSTQVGISKTDTLAYGDLFQWGRWDDGHQLRNSATGAVPAPNNPLGIGTGSATFYSGSSTAAWWNGGVLTDTWAAASNTSTAATNGCDPCKALGNHWRLPSEAEWQTAITAEQITNTSTAYSSNLKLVVGGSRSATNGSFSFVGQRGYYWSSTTSTTGAKYLYYSDVIINPSAGNTRGGGAAVRCIYNQSISINAVDVTTQNNVAATISTNAGTLQMEAAVLPANANQSVTWSVVPVSGAANISATGLVTAQSDGTVWAKAVSVTDTTQSDSLLITISNQLVSIDSVVVTTMNNVNPVIADNGSLQLIATVYPSGASQDVAWSVFNQTGAATVSSSGAVQGVQDGTVYVKAVAIQDATKSDSILVTINKPTSIQNNPLYSALYIYPNPFINTIYIKSKSFVFDETVIVTVRDVVGKVLFQNTFIQTDVNNGICIELPELQSGNYIITLKTDKTSISQTISKF